MTTIVGSSPLRKEDPPLLTGSATFAADIRLDGELTMRVVRSPVALARILSIDVSEAAAAPGVRAVWTSRDVGSLPPIGFRQVQLRELEPYRQPVLAQDWVRYVGEPVAVVFAEDAHLAEDAAELVWMDLEEHRPVLDPRLEGTFPPDRPNRAAILEKGYGDVQAAFDRADFEVTLELAVGRHTGVPMETRGALARWDGQCLRMYGASKIPHLNREALARMLGLDLDSIHLHESDVGGGFGIRGELYPEDVLVCAGALRLGRPVRWIEDRREHLLAANHSRDQVHLIRAAVRFDGFITAVDDEFWHDQGAYVRTHAATVPDLTAALLPGPYLVPAYRCRGHIVTTNKTPAGTYRAPGRYESTFVRERLLDVVAQRTGLDPVTVRTVNLIPTSSMPFDRHMQALGTDVVYDSGDYAGLLDLVASSIDLAAMQREARESRRAGRAVGIGVAMFVEKSGLGPFDEVEVTVGTDGRVQVVTGAASVGQGVETVIAQVCADALGVDYDYVDVIHGQTDLISRGMGAFASRVTVMTGTATDMAARAVLESARRIAGDILEIDPDDLHAEHGRIVVRGSPAGPSLTLGDIAQALATDSRLAGRHGSRLSEIREFLNQHMTYPYGVHIASVEIDRSTWECRVTDYVVGYDVGRAVNPTLVEGQLVGGVAQGVGGALFEEFIYDENGQPLAASLMDYLMPTMAEMPPVRIVMTEQAPTSLNPLGVKGAGEGGITAAGAAIASAIDDALEMPGLVTQIPATPDRLRSAWLERMSHIPEE
jgi:carbon-monoxide dehydrogenase large subunit/6-hydroxypseudooxynicotine dehydrogenase subunit gamma